MSHDRIASPAEERADESRRSFVGAIESCGFRVCRPEEEHCGNWGCWHPAEELEEFGSWETWQVYAFLRWWKDNDPRIPPTLLDSPAFVMAGVQDLMEILYRERTENLHTFALLVCAYAGCDFMELHPRLVELWGGGDDDE